MMPRRSILALSLLLLQYSHRSGSYSYSHSGCDPSPTHSASAAAATKCHEQHHMDIYIASGGGTGSNFLYNFLCRHGFALGSTTRDYGARWCHSLDPVTPDLATSHHIKRAIFLYSTDPVLQIESMYRQGYIEVNFRKKLGLPANAPYTFPRTFTAYCNQSRDLAQLEAQWDAWVRVAPYSHVSYPILAIQFEHLWKHLPELYRFVNLSATALPSFPPPQKRKSHGRSRSQSQPSSSSSTRRDGCDSIYRSLTHKIQDTAEFMVIWDGSTYTDMSTFFAAYASHPEHSPRQICTPPPPSSSSSSYMYYHLHIKKKRK